MIDAWGRSIDYIRISITDRCNLRCIYCMPEAGVPYLEHEEILRYEELIRICRALSELGIKKAKITGGEPLVRKNAAEFLTMLKNEGGMENVTLTTNGILLADQIDALVKAGMDSVNISLDTLDAGQYTAITRRQGVEKVLEAIDKAVKYPRLNVKVNCVPMGPNDSELIKIAELAKDRKVHVRFIEMMPIGLGKQLSYRKEEEVTSILIDKYGAIVPYEKKMGNGPARYFQMKDFCGKIGFISAISHKFCGSCNRIRLTAGGYLKTCLQYEAGVDLKQLLRNESSDEELQTAIKAAVYNKPKSHHFLEADKGQDSELHHMSQIGG